MRNFFLGCMSTYFLSLFVRGCLEGVRYGVDLRS